MYDFGNGFRINPDNLKAKPEAIIQGQKYRITILTERLVRLEYSSSFIFNDLKTELVSFRNFEVPKFEKKENDDFLEIETSYFKLSYAKETDFKASHFSPAKNLKIELKNKNFVWYYGHPEVKNYYGSNISSEVAEGRDVINRGLYSDDGVVSFEDTDNYRISDTGSIEEPIKGNRDIYVFLYDKDFGLVVQDYFTLTGLPALIPRYALGNWWCRDLPYTTDEVLKLVHEFEKRTI